MSNRDALYDMILARLEAKSVHEYQWPRWAAAQEAADAVSDWLNDRLAEVWGEGYGTGVHDERLSQDWTSRTGPSCSTQPLPGRPVKPRVRPCGCEVWDNMTIGCAEHEPVPAAPEETLHWILNNWENRQA